MKITKTTICPLCKSRSDSHFVFDPDALEAESRSFQCQNTECRKQLKVSEKKFQEWIEEELARTAPLSTSKRSEDIQDSKKSPTSLEAPPPLVSALESAIASERSLAELGRWIADPARAAQLHVRLIEMANRIRPPGPPNGHATNGSGSTETVRDETQTTSAGAEDRLALKETVKPVVPEASKSGRFGSIGRAVHELPSRVVHPLKSIRTPKTDPGGESMADGVRPSTEKLSNDHWGLVAIRASLERSSVVPTFDALPIDHWELVAKQAAIEELSTRPAQAAPEVYEARTPVQPTEVEAGRGASSPVDEGLDDGLIKILKELPRLFDAIEIPLETWRFGSKLTDEERQASGQVLEVLETIKRKLDDWKLLQNLEDVPVGPAEAQAYDPYWHERVQVEFTDDPARRDLLARTVRLGYRWNGKRLRRAEVIVFEAAIEEDATAPNALPGANPVVPPQ